jgi:hypothetical protein
MKTRKRANAAKTRPRRQPAHGGVVIGEEDRLGPA